MGSLGYDNHNSRRVIDNAIVDSCRACEHRYCKIRDDAKPTDHNYYSDDRQVNFDDPTDPGNTQLHISHLLTRKPPESFSAQDICSYLHERGVRNTGQWFLRLSNPLANLAMNDLVNLRIRPHGRFSSRPRRLL